MGSRMEVSMDIDENTIKTPRNNTQYTVDDFVKVLEHRYMNNCSWKEAAEKCHVSHHTVHWVRREKDVRWIEALRIFSETIEEESIPTAYATLLKEAQKGSISAAKTILEMAGKFKAREFNINFTANVVPIPVYLPEANTPELPENSIIVESEHDTDE